MWNLQLLERSQGFLYAGKQKAENKLSTQERLQTWHKHEQALIVLCIYAIVYVWIWRIWKYMLTNLYRVFYVMWNTWSRCNLLFLSLSGSFPLLCLPFLFVANRTYQKDKTGLFVFGRTRLSPLRRWIQSEMQVLVSVVLSFIESIKVRRKNTFFY